MNDRDLDGSLALIADYFAEHKFGHEGVEGYRKSTDLYKLTACAKTLMERGLIDSGRTRFLDLGCADGRVNVVMSYFVRLSLGIEIDCEILSEYGIRREELDERLKARALPLPPDNILLTCGSSLESETYGALQKQGGVGFGGVDLFYTYITLHDLFSEKIAAEATPGALYLVYGFNRVLPRYERLELVIPDLGQQGIAALYRKP